MLLWLCYPLLCLLEHTTTSAESVLVKLAFGSNQTGVVQLYYNGTWQIACHGLSTNKESKVICQELGYEDGLVLPVGSYGTIEGNYMYPTIYVHCDVEGQGFGKCSLNLTDNCNSNYLVVSCFNLALVSNRSSLSTFNNLSYGPLNWYAYEFKTTGQICSSLWGPEEAQVACHQLGYQGGLPTTYQKSNNMPFLINVLNCTGQEKSLDLCYRTTGACDADSRAGVVCYNRTGLNISLSDGGENYGRVNIEVDGELGAICDIGWSNKDAEVICRMMGFVTGSKWSGPVPSDQGYLYLSDVNCIGGEMSITYCPSSGWRNVTDEHCLNHTRDAGVWCYGSVRLSGGEKNSQVLMGRVEVYQSKEWTNLCTTKFEDIDAYVVCRQLGYARARVLSPASFGRSPYSNFTTDIGCHGNETNILDCPHILASCPYSEYASVVCIKEHVTDDFQIYIGNGYTGEVRVLQYGIVGTICQDGWDNKDAKVICRQHGYIDGQVYGTVKLLSQIDPIWLTNVDCSGNENNIVDCDYSMNLTFQCSSNIQPAGVICFNGTGMEVRLSGSNPAQGRLEVARDGVWGTVCDNQWTTHDAIVVCGQLGFGSGSRKIGSYYGSGTGPVFMDGMLCDGSETSIFSCSNNGWGKSDPSCSSHSKDAGVACEPWVQMSSSSRGYLWVWKRSTLQYGYVCADGFDDNAATVVCKELSGLPYGISHCCSVYGIPVELFAISHVKCSGQEKSLKQCEYYEFDTCQSGTYASVICTAFIPNPRSATNLQIISGNQGYILLNYAGYDGVICSEGFDKQDATVICKEAGYAVGIAYRHVASITSSYLRWLSNIDCNGKESKLHECGNINWGKIGNCSFESIAGVMCSANALAPTDVMVRLVNGSSIAEGRVEINVLGQWRIISSNSLTDTLALVACRMAGFIGKINATVRNYGNGEFQSLTSFIKCSGSEDSLLDCVLEPTVSSSNAVALGVLCRYESPVEVRVRLNVGNNHLAGLVEVEVYGKWGTICTNVSQSIASVVCRMAGFPAGTLETTGKFSDGGLSPRLSKVNCSGSEISLVDCILEVALPNTACPVLSVICDPPVRLLEGSTSYGKMEMYYENIWWTVCPDGMTETAIDVVCHELGYENGISLCCRPFGTPLQQNILHSVNCNDTAVTLSDCAINMLKNQSDCSIPDDYTSILCYSGYPADFTEIKLKDDGHFGEVILNFYDLDGHLCSDGWNDKNALVTCTQLGYSNGSAYYHIKEDRIDNNVQYWTINFHCEGHEQALNQCRYSSLRSDRSCLNRHNAAVFCHDSENGIKYRLIDNKNNTDRGTVEISINGHYSTICNTHWGDEEALVLCRELGYSFGEKYHSSTRSAEMSVVVYDVRYKCTGREKKLQECAHTNWKNSTTDLCSQHENDAGVYCYRSVRLYNGSSFDTNKGAVLFYLEDQWYLICNKNLTNLEAQRVCQYLGYMDGKVLCCSQFGNISFAISSFQCDGGETRLEECVKDTDCNSIDYFSVECFSALQTTVGIIDSSLPVDGSSSWGWIVLGMLLCISIVTIVFIIVCRRKNQIEYHRYDAYKQKPNVKTEVRQQNRGALNGKNPTVVDGTLQAKNPTVVDRTLHAKNPAIVDGTLQAKNPAVVDGTLHAKNHTVVDSAPENPEALTDMLQQKPSSHPSANNGYLDPITNNKNTLTNQKHDNTDNKDGYHYCDDSHNNQDSRDNYKCDKCQIVSPSNNYLTVVFRKSTIRNISTETDEVLRLCPDCNSGGNSLNNYASIRDSQIPQTCVQSDTSPYSEIVLEDSSRDICNLPPNNQYLTVIPGNFSDSQELEKNVEASGNAKNSLWKSMSIQDEIDCPINEVDSIQLTEEKTHYSDRYEITHF